MKLFFLYFMASIVLTNSFFNIIPKSQLAIYNISKQVNNQIKSDKYALNLINSLPNKKKYEATMVAPNYLTLNKFLFVFQRLKPLIIDTDAFESNISFITADVPVSIKISCDWCSINNGMMQTIKQNLKQNPELLNKVTLFDLEIATQYFDTVLVFRNDMENFDVEIRLWCFQTFDRLDRKFYMISKLYLQLEKIELLWCPFKRSKEFYYRNRDSRFMDITEQNIYKFGKILSENNTNIVCNDCTNVINKQLLNNDSESVFQPLLNFMLQELK